MVISGCTTSSDHLYLFPNGSKLEHQIEAAGEVGCRFHAARGFMSVGESKCGLPPDSLTEDEDFIIPENIIKSAKFLRKNKKFTVSSGQNINVTKQSIGLLKHKLIIVIDLIV